MRKVLLVLASMACFGMMGCAKPVQKNWEAHSGDRAAGVIRVAYRYNPMTEIPQANDAQALEIARKRCQAWGYSDAEAFGATFTECAEYAPGGCAAYLAAREYQCLGGIAEQSYTGNAQKKSR